MTVLSFAPKRSRTIKDALPDFSEAAKPYALRQDGNHVRLTATRDLTLPELRLLIRDAIALEIRMSTDNPEPPRAA